MLMFRVLCINGKGECIMGLEIERKFLAANGAWRGLAPGVAYKQGYLAIGANVAVRVRIEGNQAFLNIKQATLDIARVEYEYPIPVADAEEMLAGHCVGGIIEKTRHKIPIAGLLWEVDEFHGENAGLVIAEVELESRDQAIEKPDWVGEEVSGDARYLNANLCRNPFSQWV